MTSLFSFVVPKRAEDMTPDELSRELVAGYRCGDARRLRGEDTPVRERLRLDDCSLALIAVPDGVELWTHIVVHS